MTQFTQIPPNLEIPGQYNEIDPSLAEVGAGVFPLRGLILAQKIAAGTLAVDTPTQVFSAEEVGALAGFGSQAHRMAVRWYSKNQSTELYICLVADAGGATPAVGSITFGGTVAGGTVAVYVGGDRYEVTASGTLANMATALAAAITADANSAVSAVVNPGIAEEVTLTAKNAGVAGNSIDIRHSAQAGEALPSGLTAAVVAMSAGATDPTIDTALASFGAIQFDIISHPWPTTAALTAIEAELENRDDALDGRQGSAITGMVGTQGVLAAVGNGRNSEFSTIIGFETFPGVAHERAAGIAATVAKEGSIDPGRPFQTLAVDGYAPAPKDRFSDTARNLLLSDGIATTKTGSDGIVRIERLVTTYQTNAAGAPSDAFHDLNTLLLVSYFRKAWTARIELRFPRHKLAADGGLPPAAGVAVLTPKGYLGEFGAFYADLVKAGLCEDAQSAVANSTAVISPGDPNRIDAVLAPNFINQFRVGATLVQFRL